MSIFTALLGPVADIGKTYLSNKAAEKQAKHEAKMNVIQNDADWEAKMADASGSSFNNAVTHLNSLFQSIHHVY